MGLSSRFSRLLNSARGPLGKPRTNGANPVRLTVGGRLLRVHVEVARPGRTDASGLGPEARPEVPVPAGRSYPRRSEQTGTQDSRSYSTATGFWDVLDPTEREALRAVASWRTFAAGARIMEEGERADHVMVILGGQVEIRVDENGSEQVVAVRGLGQLVGERAALRVSVRCATVVALEMVWALVVQTKDFAAFISTHPRVLDIVQDQQYQRRAEVNNQPMHA